MPSWDPLEVEKLRECKYFKFTETSCCLHDHTRLLDILAGHKNRKGLTGQVLINGRPQPVNFRCKSAYVVQVNLYIAARDGIRSATAISVKNTG